MSKQLTERWQNVYKSEYVVMEFQNIYSDFYDTKQDADEGVGMFAAYRTHYLKSLWSKEGVFESGEFIKIEE